MVPWLLICGAISATTLPLSVPWLVMLPAPLPWVKRSVPAMKSASLSCSVLATSPPTFTCEPAPNTMPLGLTRYTWPLALSWPKICVALWSLMRLSAWLLLPGCTNWTVASRPMPKLLQFVTSLSDAWFTVSVLPDCWMLPVPRTICPPVGSVVAAGGAAPLPALAAPASMPSATAAATPAAPARLRLPLDRTCSATATKLWLASLQTSR